MKNKLILLNFRNPKNLTEAEKTLTNLGNNMQEHAYIIGKNLIWAKENLKRGEFDSWVENKMWFGRRTAYHFISFAEECDKEGRLLERPHYYLESGKVQNLHEVNLNPIKDVKNLIVIDPPWPYGTEYDEKTRRVASPYKEMDINEIIHFSEDYMFKFLQDEPIVLWLWTTNKFMHDAYHILEAWDFEPKSLLVWDKELMGIGEWLRIQTEYAILAVKGKPNWNCTNQRNIIRSKRREHSRKPDEFYKLAEELSPDAKSRIDIFGREKRDGWEIYGNEIKF